MISQNIRSQIIDAMKAKNSARMSTLKLLSSELHNEWIAKQHELSEEEELAVVRREVKKRKDAIEAYDKAGRADRAEAEKAEMAILQEFLPAEMSDEELEKIIDETISELGLADPTSPAASLGASMGKVMGAVMQKVGGRASGDRVSAMVRAKLS